METFSEQNPLNTKKSKRARETKIDLEISDIHDEEYLQTMRFQKSSMEIEPLRCKPWKYHNRDLAWLTQDRCQSLIASIRKHGQNEPALVRKIIGDPSYDFELIYGVRRWFACSVLLNRKLLAQVTDADDKTCMILMHVENAHSKDISEFERACSFSEQMKSGVFKNQNEMAEAMGLSQGTISRMIKSTEIFEHPWLKQLFLNKIEIPIKHAYALSVFLKNVNHYTVIQQEANRIQDELCGIKEHLSATTILKRLINSIKSKVFFSKDVVLLQSGEIPIVSCREEKSGKFSVFIEKEAKVVNPVLVEEVCMKAVKNYMYKLFPGE